MSDLGDGSGVKLRNWAGVPVIEFVGELNDAALKKLEIAISSLASAGHYHIVLNLKKAANANLKALESLKNTFETIRKRYGIVDLVAEGYQVRELLRMENLAGLFRINASEAQAIRKIKKLLRLPDEPVAGTSARITE
ncbi:MAG: hypothetical protein Q7N50_04410 [Armatimonadota bacterium]|nr:hypothetical protein [Armatimonadota bacterium]